MAGDEGPLEVNFYALAWPARKLAQLMRCWSVADLPKRYQGPMQALADAVKVMDEAQEDKLDKARQAFEEVANAAGG